MAELVINGADPMCSCGELSRDCGHHKPRTDGGTPSGYLTQQQFLARTGQFDKADTMPVATLNFDDSAATPDGSGILTNSGPDGGLPVLELDFAALSVFGKKKH
jgi:hypothetical protein